MRFLPYKNGACRISSPYGNRILNGVPGWHNGVDLVGLNGDRVLVAPCNGIIHSSTMIPKNEQDDTWEWGNYIRLDTEDGYNVFMCHMAERRVKVGQKVKAGDVVGIQGNTGYSFGEHCHFEVRKQGATINPAAWLGIPNEVGTYQDRNRPAENTLNSLSVGQEIYYTGSQQYAYASSEKIVSARPCRAKITQIYAKGRHPFHVVGNDVYGWVNRSDVQTMVPTCVRVTVSALNIRSGPGLSNPVVGKITDRGIYVLLAEKDGWGKLKIGGWISLAYVEKTFL